MKRSLSDLLKPRSDTHSTAPVAGDSAAHGIDQGYFWPDERVAESEASDGHSGPDGRPLGEASTRELTEKRFPCQQCGAVLHYGIGSQSLKCRYCGHSNDIAKGTESIHELDLHTALQKLHTSGQVEPGAQVISCPNCAAEFALDAHIHAGECPFCSTTVVTSTTAAKPIKPRGLLPFAITDEEARQAYQRWLSRLWFAPNELKKYARSDSSLNGVYIPYWTYDSDTVTSYNGQRGDVYYVTRRVSVIENGRRVTRTRQVPKIRWTPVRGRTSRHFDDVLVGATQTLPRKITDWLQPWDLHELVPYTEEYLSGFSSEVYQVNLDEGFNLAQSKMDRIIRGDVQQAIGGDRQRVDHMNTQHSDTTFKHVLLPVWTAGFQFRDKTYRFVVNGRSGRVRGERPYSRVKIAAAIVAGLVVLGGALTLAASSQGLNGRGFDGIRFELPMNWGSEPAPSRWPEVPLERRGGIDFPELPREWRF